MRYTPTKNTYSSVTHSQTVDNSRMHFVIFVKPYSSIDIAYIYKGEPVTQKLSFQWLIASRWSCYMENWSISLPCDASNSIKTISIKSMISLPYRTAAEWVYSHMRMWMCTHNYDRWYVTPFICAYDDRKSGRMHIGTANQYNINSSYHSIYCLQQ